ncbi:tetratricopeptide repeat protein [Sphingobium chungangianum]
MKRSALWILGGLLLTGTAQAQPAQIQSIRPSGAENLSRNLSRLASNPRDVDALVGAGEAAIEMDDMRAAAGFFSRADAIQPNNGRVKAGLGRVALKAQNPAEALRLFDQATRLGYGEATLLADRGLARDMTGDQAGAQRDYQAALKRAPDDAELTYRYAASLGISGQVDAAEKALQPLLYKSDRAAWRYRAFILAMNNKQAEARKIASQTLPAQLAAALAPYMEKMPYLTPAQKAAAVHFGHFPTNVGTSLAAATPRPSAPTVASAPVQAASPAPAQPAIPAARAQLPQPSRPSPAPTPTPPARPVLASPAPSTFAQTSTETRPAQVQGPPASIQDPAPRPAAPLPASHGQPSAPAPAAVPASQQPAAAPIQRQQPDPQATRTLADIIHAIDVPDSERQASVAAVDLSEIEALQAARRAERQAAADKAKKAATTAKEKADAAAKAKAKAEADAKAKKAAEEKARLAANPSRNWVQIGTGANRNALGFTLKALRRKYDAVAPQDGWVASWGRTNRLLIGPFASFTRAKTVEAKLKSAGADAFAWQSDAGEVVERLGGK